MCSGYQSQKVSCFNVYGWNSLTCTHYIICTLQEKQQALQSSSHLCFPHFPPQQQIWFKGSKQNCVNFIWINHSLLSISINFTLFLFFFLSDVHLCRSLRRGRCCKLCEKALNLLPPALKLRWTAWFWRWICPTVSVNPDYFNYDAHIQCLYCNFCHELVPCT